MQGSSLSTDAIDRIAPTRRPNDRVVMRQNWHDLLFLHWPVSVDQIRPLVPPELEIDTFEGTAYIGLIPFTMTGVRPVWSPSFPPLSDFHETNVRTYVHLQGAHPGVWFFSLDAANAIAVRIARAVWKLPYYYARMHMEKRAAGTDPPAAMAARNGNSSRAATVHYRTERLWPEPLPAACSVSYTPVGAISPAAPGTLDHFLVERYLLYASDGRHLYSGQVHHAPYPLQTASVHTLDENMIAAAGIRHADAPPLVHYARQVNVEIFPLHRAAASPWQPLRRDGARSHAS